MVKFEIIYCRLNMEYGVLRNALKDYEIRLFWYRYGNATRVPAALGVREAFYVLNPEISPHTLFQTSIPYSISYIKKFKLLSIHLCSSYS